MPPLPVALALLGMGLIHDCATTALGLAAPFLIHIHFKAYITQITSGPSVGFRQGPIDHAHHSCGQPCRRSTTAVAKALHSPLAYLCHTTQELHRSIQAASVKKADST